MTIPAEILCPTCGAAFHLKYQIDTSIEWRTWPMELVCPNCNDRIHLELDKNGLKPDLEKADRYAEGYLVGYCAGLPTPRPLYYEKQSHGLALSLYQTLQMVFGFEEMHLYNMALKGVMHGVDQWSEALDSLHKLLQAKELKPEYYIRKIKAIFGDDTPVDGIETVEDCHGHYVTMIGVVFANFNKGSFTSSLLNMLFRKVRHNFKSDTEGPMKVVECCKEAGVSEELYNEVAEQINKNVKDLAKFLPAFMLDFNGGSGKDLFLMTTTEKEINDLYADNFEVIGKCLPLVMAFYNQIHHGNPNIFKDKDGKAYHADMAKFISHTNGTRLNLMQRLPKLRVAFSEIADNGIRNGIHHNNTSYDHWTQTVTYAPDPSRPEIKKRYRLIDAAHAVLNQLRFLTLIFPFLRLNNRFGE
ncbi:MAG: hypothetical protein K2J70_06335 [Muribaculaceae bacterium]|nr:hypothetical protein [Muribaculaceae bacterium]